MLARSQLVLFALLAALAAVALASETCPDMSAARKVPFTLMGSGGVGAALLKAIVGARDLHAKDYGLRLCATAVCDSSAVAKGTDGELSDQAIASLLEHKAAGGKLVDLVVNGVSISAKPAEASAQDFLKTVAAADGGGMLVDCTATEDTIPALLAAAAGGGRVVSANKKPFSSAYTTFEQLVRRPAAPATIRFEATVGAGLPVIAAVQRTLGAADPISAISGSFSGTLGYVMSGLQEGRPFSEVVGTAKGLGYTEPDPRDDLGGVDVARKALILARCLGLKLELEQVKVEPLYPAELASLSVPEFMAALPSLDASFSDKVAAAAKAGKVLRYAASVEPATNSLTVGLKEVAVSSPLGTLSGSDNLVEVYTQWYNDNPLVLRGAGAGTGATAAGVLADMLDLAYTAA
eukprot:Transcript_21003.p1 GENE.Transcript_21003~~Transcript_21003.p1  ORF type:complete len:407 (-),score=156.82 Transcript_21003:893-2113(-)